MPNPVLDFLQQMSVNDLIKTQKKQQEIVEVEANTSIFDTLTILKEKAILSVPVFNKDSGDYVGFVDVMDIISFILEMYTKVLDAKEITWSKWVGDMETLSHRGIRFGLTPIKQVINKSRMDNFFPVYGHGTVFQLVEEMFCKGIHRVPVMNEQNRVINIVSQSDVVSLLSSNKELLGKFGKQTVASLNLGSPNIITMSIHAPAITAFYLMHVHKVSAIAIVDAEGVMRANLSASDIRGFDAMQFAELVEPCSTYLSKKYGGISVPITCEKQNSFESLVTRLALNRIHRMWIVDEKGDPTGVISLTDVMKKIADIVW